MRYLLYLVILSAGMHLPAQTSALERLVDKCDLLVAITDVGWRQGLCLARGQTTVGGQLLLETYLEAGSSYVFLATGDRTVTDLDLSVFDANGQRLASDLADDDTPVVRFVARTDGRYLLQLHLVAAERDTAEVAISMLEPGGSVFPEGELRGAADRLHEPGTASAATGWSEFGLCLYRGGAASTTISMPFGGEISISSSATPKIKNFRLYCADASLKVLAARKDESPSLELSARPGPTIELGVTDVRASGAGMIMLRLH